MILLLDTTVLIDVLRSRQNRRVLLATLAAAGHAFATSAVNIGEVYAGMRASEEARTEAFLSTVDCYSVTEAIARRAGEAEEHLCSYRNDPHARRHDGRSHRFGAWTDVDDGQRQGLSRC